jgi:hypothetical protein
MISLLQNECAMKKAARLAILEVAVLLAVGMSKGLCQDAERWYSRE